MFKRVKSVEMWPIACEWDMLVQERRATILSFSTVQSSGSRAEIPLSFFHHDSMHSWGLLVQFSYHYFEMIAP